MAILVSVSRTLLVLSGCAVGDGEVLDPGDGAAPGDTAAPGDSHDGDSGPVVWDADGDGYASDVDCDDHDSSINPGATEVCGNGVDEDCNSANDSCDGGNPDIESGEYTIDVDGTERSFILSLPSGYGGAQAYPLVFAWHGWGGSASGVANSSFFGLKSAASNEAIFIAGQGLNAGGLGAGWPNEGGRDVAFVRVLIEWAKTNLSIDETHIFSTGFSYGGMFSNLLGCELGSVLRGIAPIAGNLQSIGITNPSSQCSGDRVAYWGVHGSADSIVSPSSGQKARDYYLDVNGCSDSSTPIDPSGCESYNDCDSGYPVTWCSHDGGHLVPSFVGPGAWSFFSQF